MRTPHFLWFLQYPHMTPSLVARLKEEGDWESLYESKSMLSRDERFPTSFRKFLAEYELTPEEVIERYESSGVKWTVMWDEDYPEKLERSLRDPPVVLYYRGDISLLRGRCVAVVGTRKPTEYGKKMARSIGKGLADAGVAVVSGLALGIDAAAHSGALETNGRTVAVLGAGVDVVYPPENRELFETISERGLLISEFPLGVRPERFFFPRRNRVIAGVSDGVVVVESALRGGGMITASLALDCGKEVMAVPGRVTNWQSEGPHALLKNGAYLVESSADVLEALYPVQPSAVSSSRRRKEISIEDEEQRKVYSVLSDADGSLSFEELKRRTGLADDRLTVALVSLEMAGLVKRNVPFGYQVI